MAGVADFIQMATQQLGIGEGEAKSGAGALLKAVQGAVSPDEFGQVEAALPDVGEVMGAAPAEEGGGGLGGLMSKAAGALGGAGGAAGLVGTLAKAGIAGDKVGSFASLFVNFLKDKLPAGLVDGILGKLGALKGLLG